VPRPIDPGRLTKAAKYGLQVYLVGTEKCKDLIIGFGENGGRLRLSEKRDGNVVTGNGPGRMHWYRGIRGDYFKQVASEVKAPMKGRPRGRLYWQQKAGVRNEGLDCENYSLHSARRLRINLMTETQWSAIEQRLRQPDLVGVAVQANSSQPARTPAPAEHPTSAPLATAETQAPQRPTTHRDKIAEQFESDYGSRSGGARWSNTPY
jgi:phage terminase large subunit GpA-like protein